MSTTEQKSTKSALDWAMLDVRLPLRDLNHDDRNLRINALNRFVGNPVGSPYCAAGVSWCFQQAGAKNFPFNGLAKSIHDWFAQRKLVSRDPQKLLEWKGALFGWTEPSGHGHIGFVARRLTDSSGKVTAIGTAEYNTTPPQGGDGPDGAYCKERAVCNGGEIWFLRCDGIEGGAWWD